MSIFRAWCRAVASTPDDLINKGHRPTAQPGTVDAPPPAPPVGPAGVVRVQLGAPLSQAELEKIVLDQQDVPPVILPEGFRVEPGPLPVEAQILLRVMGEDLQTAEDLITAMRPVDRAILKFYLSEATALIYKVDEREGRY